jgi:phytoene synthase
MFALYAYMRHVDDIADAQDGRTLQQRADELERWRQQTRAALAENSLDSYGSGAAQLWPAFAQTVRRYNIPPHLFESAVQGQSRDLHRTPVENFQQLHDYCYCVAGVVGLASIHIWGFEGGAETEQLAIARGVAFQLTNIIRDVREDAQRGRVYLPADELAAAHIEANELLDDGLGDRDGSVAEFLRAQIARADSYYARSADLERRISSDSRPTLIAMTDIYHTLLRKAAVNPARVLRERVSLSTMAKLRIAWRAVQASRATARVAPR